ncbi:efflux RND transporter periplasmic adaptor subunit [Acidisphaera sp. L21]|uniref:efflux RND transporter periplasmic adaptor subunit n=1 Tax=Acidisphaera sp. L21 TaxID=1641851 RepID=UPI0020B14269|nr:efflux RND transporter periplasmic adaptor subunit [Acidisphaera sp. L21]
MISSQALAQAPPPTVTVATPLSRVIADWDESTGRFTPSQSVEVRPRVTGFVDALYFRDGQLVKPGDLLFTIDPRPYQIAVDSTQADVDRTSAAVEIAALEVHRGEPLVPAQALPQSQLDMRRSTLRQAQANRDSALAALHNAQLNLSWTEVRAPIAGRISDRRVDVGNLVNGGQNGMTPTLLTTIVALDPIYLEFDAAEADYLKYVRLAHSGQRPSGRIVRNPVEVKLQDETTWLHKGTLDFIDNVVNSRSGTIRGRGIFDNGDQLLTLEDLREFGYGPETPKCC